MKEDKNNTINKKKEESISTKKKICLSDNKVEYISASASNINAMNRANYVRVSNPHLDIVVEVGWNRSQVSNKEDALDIVNYYNEVVFKRLYKNQDEDMAHK